MWWMRRLRCGETLRIGYTLLMAQPAIRSQSYADYLRVEQETGIKHEYLDGFYVAMAGGTPSHALIGSRITHLLTAGLEGRPCRPFNSDLKIRIAESGLATYPDASVICGGLLLDAEDPNAVTNPSVLVEVLSKGTEAYDRGEKWSHYRKLSSLREYVLVASQRIAVEVFRRGVDGEWIYVSYGPGERISLPSIEMDLSVDAIYAGWAELVAAEQAEAAATA